jgi:hypothetical protein
MTATTGVTDRDRELAREVLDEFNRIRDLVQGGYSCSRSPREVIAAALATAREEGRQEGTKWLVPSDGSLWHWEPTRPHASVIVRVVSSGWNGEEWWVQTSDANGNPTWNDLGRFLEASVLLEVDE